MRKLIIFEGNDATGKSYLSELEYNTLSDIGNTIHCFTPYIARDEIKHNTMSNISRQLLASASHFDMLYKFDVNDDKDYIMDRSFISSLVYFLSAKYDDIDDVINATFYDIEYLALINLYTLVLQSMQSKFDDIIFKYVHRNEPFNRINDKDDEDVFSVDIEKWKLRNQIYEHILMNEFVNVIDVEFINNDYNANADIENISKNDNIIKAQFEAIDVNGDEVEIIWTERYE